MNLRCLKSQENEVGLIKTEIKMYNINLKLFSGNLNNMEEVYFK